MPCTRSSSNNKAVNGRRIKLINHNWLSELAALILTANAGYTLKKICNGNNGGSDGGQFQDCNSFWYSSFRSSMALQMAFPNAVESVDGQDLLECTLKSTAQCKGHTQIMILASPETNQSWLTINKLTYILISHNVGHPITILGHGTKSTGWGNHTGLHLPGKANRCLRCRQGEGELEGLQVGYVTDKHRQTDVEDRLGIKWYIGSVLVLRTLSWKIRGRGSIFNPLATMYSPKRCRSMPMPRMASNLYFSWYLHVKGQKMNDPCRVVSFSLNSRNSFFEKSLDLFSGHRRIIHSLGRKRREEVMRHCT